jgi:peptidoglycan hydrolase-like protein with peptidoglycan-binding domain
MLAPGSRGVEVERLQRALKLRGLYIAHPIDGEYGAQTANAVSQFQARVGIYADGIADAVTLEKLRLIRTE